ncbi:hypothetical protein LY76DRAFT_390128 [Colletotrichum caudatum]|nr:hypothetical protein LY76DRAFT_390128 [Colletotrichum caudatum]
MSTTPAGQPTLTISIKWHRCRPVSTSGNTEQTSPRVFFQPDRPLPPTGWQPQSIKINQPSSAGNLALLSGTLLTHDAKPAHHGWGGESGPHPPTRPFGVFNPPRLPLLPVNYDVRIRRKTTVRIPPPPPQPPATTRAPRAWTRAGLDRELPQIYTSSPCTMAAWQHYR